MSKDKKEESKELTGLDTDVTIIDEIEEQVKTEEQPPVKNQEFDYIVGTVTTETSYMRKEPFKTGLINIVLKKGDVVIIDPEGDVVNYYRVTAKTKIGYVLKNEISVK